MASTSIPIRPIAVGLAALPAIYLAVHVYGRVSLTPRNKITTRKEFSASLRESPVVKKVVNPRDRVMAGDSRSIDLHVSDRAARVKDEALLAAFTRGFFGGSVFAPERVFLGLVGPTLLDFPEIENSTIPSHIWDARDLDSERLPPHRAVLFGDFLAGDISLCRIDDAAATGEHSSSESTIDFIYGSNTSSFAGVHRFGITRFADRPGTIRVSFESAICNPTIDQDLGSSILFTFHGFYAAMLFRESVGEVQRRLKMEGE